MPRQTTSRDFFRNCILSYGFPSTGEVGQKCSFSIHSRIAIFGSSSRLIDCSSVLPFYGVVADRWLEEALMISFFMLGELSTGEWTLAMDFFMMTMYCGASRVMKQQWWTYSTKITNFLVRLSILVSTTLEHSTFSYRARPRMVFICHQISMVHASLFCLSLVRVGLGIHENYSPTSFEGIPLQRDLAWASKLAILSWVSRLIVTIKLR